MRRNIFIYLMLATGVAFTFTPRGAKFAPFPFYQEWYEGKIISNSKLIHIEDYCYYFWEHVCWIYAFKIIYTDTFQRSRFFLGAVFAWQIFDLLDFILTYNTEWTYVGLFPVSSNTFAAVGLAIILICNAWTQQQHNK